jgi:hypothetical protein
VENAYIVTIQDDSGFTIGFLTRSHNGHVSYRLRDAEGAVILDHPDLEFMINSGVPSKREELIRIARYVKREAELNRLRNQDKDIDRDHER